MVLTTPRALLCALLTFNAVFARPTKPILEADDGRVVAIARRATASSDGPVDVVASFSDPSDVYLTPDNAPVEIKQSEASALSTSCSTAIAATASLTEDAAVPMSSTSAPVVAPTVSTVSLSASASSDISAGPTSSGSATASGYPNSSTQTTTASTSSPSGSSENFPDTGSSTSYWLGDDSFHNQISPVYGQSTSEYKLYRNVKDYGATGDGSTDDTAAINKAIADGNRCGQGCNSSTTSPAIVYFPPGSYVVSKPIIQYYYTQMIGDALNLPTIVGSASFEGMALIDSDPYDSDGTNWYINQNNFFRQVRNFNIDLTNMGDTGAGIHWQVAQATSLQNINFKMNKGGNNKQIGVFMDNGSGGFMSDLTFEGGNYGCFYGSQQFTARNLVFNNCNTSIFMNWNWGWTFSNVTINGGVTGIDMANAPTNQTVGSMVLADSKISGVTYGIVSAYSMSGNTPEAGGTLVIDNVDIDASVGAVVSPDKSVIAASGKIDTWVSGNGYANSATGSPYQKSLTETAKAPGLLDSSGNIFGRSKPQYETVPASEFMSSKASGCKGDGSSDDTQCIQSFLDAAAQQNKIAYFDYGAYVVSDTVTVSSSARIVGECWPLIVAKGFSDMSSPKAVFQVGKADGSTKGAVEITDMLFSIQGSNPGAIMIQWNLDSEQGQSGMWDTHVRMGGSYGSDLLVDECLKDPQSTTINEKCEAGFLMFHATKSANNLYLENTWYWTADHDMEDPMQRQISVYNGRGVLIQAQGPVWLWGTASEHSIMYNYQFDGVQALFAGFIQTETPYMQPNPPAPAPFVPVAQFDDPEFELCASGASAGDVPCKDSWGMRIINSTDVLIYSAGMYSFFNNYDQQCVTDQNCQENMIRVQNSKVTMFAVSTKAAVNMIYDDNSGAVTKILDADNRSNFCSTIAFYTSSPL